MVSPLSTKLEALLFASDKPLGIKKLADFLDVKPAAIEEALQTLSERLASRESGVRLVRTGSEVQMMTSPELSKLVRDFLKDELTGELTKPQLETLTVIAYRQPITKPELEQIRGVNCSLIIRNLLMRGLVETEEVREKFGPVYRVTHDFLRFLGLTDVRALPDYEKLHADEHITAVLSEPKGGGV
ncbi:SMC-Scp complex subunit ScpB [Candidatus Uhrbacteria bacterium]|nr:SMC-Scp complex subunit ScpB [Candidatus Uhrbacteria bacterium]